MPKCRTKLVGIKLVYCVDGEYEEVWVDLNRVHALSWCDGYVAAKNGGGGNNKLPTDPNGPKDCPEPDMMGTTAEEVPICWWNGTEWVCGEEA